MPTDSSRLTRTDLLLLATFALVLFGYACVSGKPLTMHEARLPELAREMVNTGQWAIAHSGGRPWVERPPLPQWIVAVFFSLFGASAGVARLPGAILGTITCLLTASTASRLFGRTIGLLAGFALATTYEFYVYATLAEDEVYLSTLVALCVWALVRSLFALVPLPSREGLGEGAVRGSSGLVDVSPPHLTSPSREEGSYKIGFTVVFFIALGMTSLVRGPGVGIVQVGAIVGSFLVLGAIFQKQNLFGPWNILIWLIGGLVACALAAGWYVYAGTHLSELWTNLRYDFFSGWGHKPRWYYLQVLTWTTQPWTLFALGALVLTAKQLTSDRRVLFAWCMALAPIVVMSIPTRKAHHYLVPVLAGWSVMSAVGLEAFWRWGCSLKSRPATVIATYSLIGLAIGATVIMLSLRGKIDGPWQLSAIVGGAVAAIVIYMGTAAARRDGRDVFAGFLACFLVIGSWQQTAYAVFSAQRMADYRFARGVDEFVPRGAPLFIIHKESLDFFLLQFYMRPDAKLLHNPTWLLDKSIIAPSVYVVTRAYDVDWIQQHVGDVETIAMADYSRREEDLGGAVARWALLRVIYRPNMTRYDAVPIDAFKAMKRPDPNDESPYLGPDRPKAAPTTLPDATGE
ncbi:MAG: glycosyltransferase family 39 protein [Tepidisphaeraceae bacterium]